MAVLDDQLEEQRRDLVLHCYRMLGSHHDAEEAAQEALLRAWRARDSFRGDASIRTWVHKIGTRVCLDQLRSRASRPTPVQLGSASDPSSPPGPPPNDISWLEPIPTVAVLHAVPDPASAYSLAESVKLAFIAALQTLPPRQRAVLILRDVLAMSAAETADTLEMSVAAANSALNRARQQLRDTYHEGGVESFPGTEPEDPVAVATLDAYVSAWQRDDVDGLVRTLREDVKLAMPPVRSWYSGRDDVAVFLRTWILPQGRFEMVPAHANAQPAFVIFAVTPEGDRQPLGIQVVTVDPSGIWAIDSFMTPGLATPFLDQG